MRATVVLIVLMLCFGSALQAQNTTLQGILRDANGQPLASGMYTVTFSIYDAQAGGHTALWEKTCNYLVAQKGVFYAQIARGEAPANLQHGGQYVLAIAVKDQPATTQRLPLMLMPNTRGLQNMYSDYRYKAPAVLDYAYTLLYEANINDLAEQVQEQQELINELLKENQQLKASQPAHAVRASNGD